MTEEYLAESLERGVLHRDMQVGDIIIKDGLAHIISSIDDDDGTVVLVDATIGQVERRRAAIERHRELNR